MSFTLYEHNKIAYENAVGMLAEAGKAAIIHPTGTGKSFIGFQLCLDHPEAVICWVAPSEFIYQTQMENLIHAGGEIPENIHFYTYARLMNMSTAELQLIRPDYIILDEFHRCGAEMWGKGISHLLQIYPQIPILGLSATAIRYLDNQRNMAEELFGGNIASEISLGEAIVRGILRAPIYVLGMYTYQKDLEKYQQRINREKNPKLRARAEAYLDALRRSLEQAEGVDVLFHKYMKEKHGKYLVFCSNYEHMTEMISHVPEWFGKVDTKPHIYQAYSEDPDTDTAFAQFKADDSDHLKLLFCIDMLNEGIHVNDITGVILLRPTVSPIIYKQQIGRALSARKNCTPYIFDLVANIDGLYSIGEVQEEMQAALSNYYVAGDGTGIVQEQFQLHGELRECLELFEQLNETLRISWDKMYELAKAYYEKYGDLLVPLSYKTEEGYSLGTWLASMRNARKGTTDRTLTEEQIRLLDAIGMRWENRSDYLWIRNYTALEKYHQTYGNIDVPFHYETENGIPLGKWVNNLRSYRNSEIQRKQVTPERIQALNALGMIWNKTDQLWEKNYQALLRYVETYGNAEVPRTYQSEDGINLGVWVYNLRYQYRKHGEATLEPEKRSRLEALGLSLAGYKTMDKEWYEKYCQARNYYQTYGNLNVPCSYTTEDGFPLGVWIRRHRKNSGNKSGIRVDRERKELLDQIGMIWEIKNEEPTWEECYQAAAQYYRTHGNLELSPSAVVEEIPLGKWLSYQRKAAEKGTLSEFQKKQLDQLHYNWQPIRAQKWEKYYQEACAFHQENGHYQIPSSRNGLKRWVKSQQEKYQQGQLNEIQIQRLMEIGLLSVPSEKADLPEHRKTENATIERTWQRHYRLAETYARTYGHLRIPARFETEKHEKLGIWISVQREAYTKGKLSQEKVQALEKIGMEWSAFQSSWENGFQKAKSFFLLYGNLEMPATYLTEDGFHLGAWLVSQREKYKKKKLTIEQIQRLESIGMVWSQNEVLWMKGYTYARDYYQKTGTLAMAATYILPDGYRLGQWVYQQKRKYQRRELEGKKVELLKEIGAFPEK